MSVINRVLKDLDRNGASPRTLAGVQAVQDELPPTRPRWPLLAILVALSGVAYWYWPTATRPDASPNRERLGTLKPQPTMPRPDLPRLRMSESLNQVAPESTPQAAPSVAQSPRVTMPGAASKLDTHLPEPRPARFVKALRPESPHERADQLWGQATRLIEAGRGREAMEILDASLRLEPEHGPARQALIALSMEADAGARAETLLRDGQKLFPKDAWYDRSLAQLCLQRGETARAAAVLKAGLAKGVNASYWGLYGGVLEKAGRPEDAAQAYREAVRLEPEHGPWWIGLGVTLEQAGQRAAAAAAYQHALQTRLDPEVREFAAKKAAELVTTPLP